MNAIIAIVVSALLITTTTSFVKECEAAVQMNAASVTPEKEYADESVEQALKTIDLFRDGSIPTVEQVIEFDNALTTIAEALRNKTITSEEVLLKGRKKHWFMELVLSLKKLEESERKLPEEKRSRVGWLTVMYQFEIMMDIKAAQEVSHGSTSSLPKRKGTCSETSQRLTKSWLFVSKWANA